MSEKPAKGTLPPVGDRKVTIRKPLVAILDVLAEELVTDATELVNQAVREWLTDCDLWPMPSNDAAGIRQAVRQWLRSRATRPPKREGESAA